MLTDVLSFNERLVGGVKTAFDHDALRKTLELLHKDDKAVRRYFGFDRRALMEECHRISLSAHNKESSAVEVLDQKIKDVASLSFENELDSHEAFSVFYARWYAYLKFVFENDQKYNSICGWVNTESFLPGIRLHITALVKGLSEKSLVYQLNSQMAEGVDLDLQGFDQAMAGGGFSSFLSSYPVLTRLLMVRIEDTVAYLYKVIGHFADDSQRLKTTFALPDTRIDSITLGLGDSHANGETVCCLQIGNQALMYKPRSNREAMFYGELLRQLHERSGEACFSVYVPIMVSLDNHCWIEKIDNLACETHSDLSLFFQRLGAQVAVIHALNGIDFHYENIIACGSSPVMIDLECLFTPVMVDLRVNLPHSRALFKTIKLNSQSVYASGFVPNSPDSDNDYSGLSCQQQFVAKKRQLVREQRFYRLKPIDAQSRPVIRHLPVFESRTYSVTDHKDAFFRGFEAGYDEMMNHRGAVLELLEQHAQSLKTRVLIKNTQRYADFIGMMLHPRFTRCGLQRDLLLATLWSELNETLNNYGIPRHEISDLAKANFPCFTLPLLSNSLLDAHGQAVASLVIERPFDSCRRKLENLSPEHKAFQIHIVQMCLFPVANEALPLNREHHLKTAPDLSRAHYLEHAMTIAGIIERTRVEGEEGDVAWTFMDTHPRTRRHFISPMGSGLYNGMGGLAIFYLSLFRASGATRYLQEAERILVGISKSQGHFASELTVSAYFGLTSYLYVLVNYQIMTGHQTYQASIDETVLQLADFPREGDEFDFIHGWCGAVTVLVNLYQLEKRETLLPLIEKFSQAIQSALTLDNGTLLLKATGKPLLTGFSHGISGVLHALGKVWEVTKAPGLAELIAQVLQAENRLTIDGFWLDLRETAKSASTVKWCHGDAGILISRRGLTRTLGEALDADTRTVLEQDAERCERHLWEQGLGSGYSLCHGDFGNLMCLLRLYRDTCNEQGIARVNRALSQLAQNFFNEDFLDERTIPDPGLMLGIAGVGQALLHAVADGLPDVLSLEFARPVSA